MRRDPELVWTPSEVATALMVVLLLDVPQLSCDVSPAVGCPSVNLASQARCKFWITRDRYLLRWFVRRGATEQRPTVTSAETYADSGQST